MDAELFPDFERRHTDMTSTPTLPLSLLTTFVMLGCASTPAASRVEPAPDPALESGIALENIDGSIRPQDDFYRHVNGGWLARTEIPGDRSNYGSFTQLSDEAEDNLRVLVEEVAAMESAAPGSDAQKVGALYRSFMDTARIEALGIRAVQPELDAIAAVSSVAELPAFWGATAATRLALMTDSHAPSEYRTNGIVVHMRRSTRPSTCSPAMGCGWHRSRG